jgi:hypothetical protein
MALVSVPAVIAFCRPAGLSGLAGSALAFLWLMPRFLGHIPNNSKDTPLAIAMIAFFAMLVKASTETVLTWRSALALGLCTGWVLSVRPASLPLLVLFLVSQLALVRVLGLRSSSASSRFSRYVRLAVAFVIAWSIMILTWPWTHAHPLLQPLGSIAYAMNFPAEFDTLFEGTLLKSTALPFYYLPKYLAIATPPSILAFATLGLIAELWKLRAATDRSRSVVALAALIWLILPLVVFMALRPNMYDGMRHVLFLLPPLAVLAGFGALAFWAQLKRYVSPAFSTGLTAAAVGLPLLPALFSLHPYQTSYFSPLVGGIRGADGRYEIDYWGSSYREAIEWLNSHAPEQRVDRKITVLLGSSSNLAKAGVKSHADSRFEILTFEDLGPHGSFLITDFPVVDYYIATKRLGYDGVVEGTVVFEVQRQGVTLTW